eukprot:2690068-Pyramimonas_sp.AAC.1
MSDVLSSLFSSGQCCVRGLNDRAPAFPPEGDNARGELTNDSVSAGAHPLSLRTWAPEPSQ